ncbi:hypothetical protein Agabi119p4_1851 [Agaricus bisporus var. burnettii]|uniref:Zn(2)-C6 fungal-type domain-containing protein n=1 Tax=Agaricus bisporus var. burnettii TaxID=192524 RepID=A0A8H7KJT8_AGABI|nr:hypothetical protein Agabi119p4_1851 [Agaricus bisporus var. burnettii]
MASSSLNKEGLEASSVDDNQLTIRIPNPKMYMARQSLWIGHRGKPRCDHCRVNNLKCDRVLPTCNHCSWATGRDCRYTPLPTPAHRGIPRCDRCRLKNLKCDRNLPICNHCSEQDEMDCNYTPKKRTKLSMDHTMTLNGPEDAGGAHHPFFVASRQPTSPGYGQNVTSSTKGSSRGRTISPASSEGVSQETEIPRSHTGRFTAEIATSSSLNQLMPSTISHSHSSPFVSHSFVPEQAVILKSSVVEPWNNMAFPSLPAFMLNRLHLMNSVEIPSPEAFTTAFRLFLDNLITELKETTCLSPDIYSRVANCLRKGNLHELPENLRAWISFHRLCSGSEKHHLILAPRDAILDTSEAEFEKLRRSYCQKIDDPFSDNDNSEEVLFDRLPLQPQVYDILNYVHRSHAPVPEMLREIKKLGFSSITWPIIEMYARLCPLCTIQHRHDTHAVKWEE